MIRQLARCPYCKKGDLALDENTDALIFNADVVGVPCPHLLWVEGRYSAWERTPQGIPRVIGSFEFHWDHPGLAAADVEGQLQPYLKELANTGKSWEFAPAQEFTVADLFVEEKATDPRGKEYPLWEVDGEAIFAPDAAAFLAALPACQEKHRASLRVDETDRQT